MLLKKRAVNWLYICIIGDITLKTVFNSENIYLSLPVLSAITCPICHYLSCLEIA